MVESIGPKTMPTIGNVKATVPDKKNKPKQPPVEKDKEPEEDEERRVGSQIDEHC